MPDDLVDLLVLDFEIVGDLGGVELAEGHARQLETAGRELREALGRLARYRLVTDPAARERMADITRRAYLHARNGCERTLARAFGARQVQVPWVHRVSALVLTLNAQIRDVADGGIPFHRSLDFRGDDERAWTRAIDYLVRELEEEGPPLTARRAAPIR